MARISEAEFLARGRRGGDRRDLGVGWRKDDGERGRVTWIQASGEIYVADGTDHVEILGELEPWDLVWAIVRSRRSGNGASPGSATPSPRLHEIHPESMRS